MLDHGKLRTFIYRLRGKPLLVRGKVLQIVLTIFGITGGQAADVLTRVPEGRCARTVT